MNMEQHSNNEHSKKDNIEESLKAVLPLLNPDPIFITDLKGHILFTNPSGSELLQRRATDDMQAILPESCIGKTCQGLDCSNPMHQLGNRVYRVSCCTVSDHHIITWFFHDQTESMQLAQEAASAARAKDEFISTMSHELKTPLNAIIGFAQVLDAEYYGPLSEQQKNYVKDILDSGYYLLQLIEDILDLSKLEGGKEYVRQENINLVSTMERVLLLMREKAHAKSIEFKLNVSPQFPHRICTDEMKVKQILFNLLSNALKFSPKNAEVRVSLYVEEGEINIAVTDFGPGIPLHDQRKIFLPFVKLNSTSEGTGIGLAISSKLATQLGGAITLHSPLTKKDHGATFILKFPHIMAENET